MAKETFYFSHDYNARSDMKIKKLISKHGMLGYGVYWAIVEDLYNNANALQLDCEVIAYDLRVISDLVESVLNDFDLFEINNNIISSNSVGKRLEARNAKSIKARKSALKRWEKSEGNANAEQSQFEPNAIKESKVKESKVKEIEKDKKDSPSSFDFKKELINFGFNEELVTEWVAFRKRNKQNNSKTAFNTFVKQVELNGGDKNDILTQVVANSWKGFKHSYLDKGYTEAKQQNNALEGSKFRMTF